MACSMTCASMASASDVTEDMTGRGCFVFVAMGGVCIEVVVVIVEDPGCGCVESSVVPSGKSGIAEGGEGPEAEAEAGSELRRRSVRLLEMVRESVRASPVAVVVTEDMGVVRDVVLVVLVLVLVPDGVGPNNNESLCNVKRSSHTFSGACKLRKVCTVSSRARTISKSPVPATCTTLEMSSHGKSRVLSNRKNVPSKRKALLPAVRMPL